MESKLGLCSDSSPADPAMTSSSSSFWDPSSYSRPAYWRCPGPGACPGPGFPSAETEASPTQDGMTGSSKCTHSFPQSENLTGKFFSILELDIPNLHYIEKCPGYSSKITLCVPCIKESEMGSIKLVNEIKLFFRITFLRIIINNNKKNVNKNNNTI